MAENDDLRADIIIGTKDIDTAAKKAAALERKIEEFRKANLRAAKIAQSKREAGLKASLKREEITHQQFVKRIVKLEEEKARKIASINRIAERRQARVRAGQPRPGAPAPSASSGGGLASLAAGGIAAAGLQRAAGLMFDLAIQTDNANKSLEAMDAIVGTKLGEDSIPKARDAMRELTRSGLLNKSDASQSIKNLTNMGFTIDQTTKFLSANLDMAVKNKQSHLGISEAVRLQTEGWKNNNSILSDSTGLSENVSQVLKRLGGTHDDLRDAAKGAALRQAVVNDMLKETAPFAGDADKSLKTFGGTVAKMSQAWTELKLSMGGGAQSVFGTFLPAVTGLITKFTDMVSVLGSTKAGATALTVLFWPLVKLFTFTVSVLRGLIAALGWLFDGFKALITIIESNTAFQTLIRVLSKAWQIASDLAEKISKGIGGALEAIGESDFLAGLSDGFTFLFNGVLKFLAVLNQLKEIALPLFEGLGNGFKAVGLAAAFQFKAADAAASAGERAFNRASKASDNFLDKARKTFHEWGRLKDDLNKKGTGGGVGGRGPVAAATGGAGGGAGGDDSQIIDGKTTAEKLEEERAFLEQQSELRKNFFAQDAIAQRQEDIDRALERGQMLNNELTSLDKLELEKRELIKKHNKERQKDEKKKLKFEMKLIDEKIKAEQKHLDIKKNLDVASKQQAAKRAADMFDFGQALMSEEEGALVKFLAGVIRREARAWSTRAYARGLFYAADPLTAALAPAQFAAAAGIQLLGEGAARLVESLGPDKEEASTAPTIPSFDTTPGDGDFESTQVSGDNISNKTGPTTIINNYNTENNVEIREEGTYLTEEEYVRNKVVPQMQNVALERGTVIFTKS